MSHKSNSAWKLDLLETKFHDFNPRFPHTKKLLRSKNQKLLKRLPTTKEEANIEIQALKSDFFHKKYYGAQKKLEKEVTKITRADLSNLKASTDKQTIVEFLESKEYVDQLITSKLAKLISTAITNTKDLKQDPPKYLDEVREILVDKSHKSNPTAFFKTHCQENKLLNNYLSNIWNKKSVKTLLAEIDWSFRLVRGNLSKQERVEKRKATGKEADSDDEGDNSASESDSDSDDSADSEGDEEVELDPGVFDKFAIYDKLDGEGSDEEFEVDPNVNYNEITDEEASEEEDDDEDDEDDSEEEHDSFFAEEPKQKKQDKKEKKDKKKKEAFNLPELASGYYSGGSEDEEDFDGDDDDVVKEATSQRKNRRGQRARQKIWEKKFGRDAKHVKAEKEKIATEREIRQQEYEERCRKRELKAKLAAPSGSNVLPLGERGTHVPGQVAAPPAPQKMHPSWEAKKLAEEKQKNTKFTGKKITFD